MWVCLVCVWVFEAVCGGCMVVMDIDQASVMLKVVDTLNKKRLMNGSTRELLTSIYWCQ